MKTLNQYVVVNYNFATSREITKTIEAVTPRAALMKFNKDVFSFPSNTAIYDKAKYDNGEKKIIYSTVAR